MKKLSLIAVALLLSACGGGHSIGGVDPAPTPPAPAVDTFYAYVLSLVGDAPDTSEPVATDAVVATAPEDTEPVPQK